jgi:hypothetical protein
MMLDRLLRAREHLRVISVKDAWTEAMAPQYAARGAQIAIRLSSDEFWSNIQLSLKVMKPIFVLLCDMDGEHTMFFGLQKILCIHTYSTQGGVLNKT